MLRLESQLRLLLERNRCYTESMQVIDLYHPVVYPAAGTDLAPRCNRTANGGGLIII